MLAVAVQPRTAAPAGQAATRDRRGSRTRAGSSGLRFVVALHLQEKACPPGLRERAAAAQRASNHVLWLKSCPCTPAHCEDGHLHAAGRSGPRIARAGLNLWKRPQTASSIKRRPSFTGEENWSSRSRYGVRWSSRVEEVRASSTPHSVDSNRAVASGSKRLLCTYSFDRRPAPSRARSIRLNHTTALRTVPFLGVPALVVVWAGSQ
jgi:hypothetical protein